MESVSKADYDALLDKMSELTEECDALGKKNLHLEENFANLRDELERLHKYAVYLYLTHTPKTPICLSKHELQPPFKKP